MEFYLVVHISYDSLLTSILSSVFTAAFISWMLAAVITTYNGMPCHMLLHDDVLFLIASVYLSVGLGPVISTLKVHL